ncbi:MAG TPA: outer membrane lipoprotein chaperone LolA [Gammaproteobacteria bacterium]|jgi:outer membrane lipoprotein carrier protein
MVKKLFIGFALTLLISPAFAGEGLEKLQKFTNELRSMKADFTQTLFDDKMSPVEIAKGKVMLLKPGKFRWDYTAPYEQHIIADGEKLWLYDPELEQVTVKNMSEALGAAPIALLTSEQKLEDQFKIIELGNIGGREMLQLEAKVKDTDYGLMLLALGDKGLEVMELKDKLGQVTRIEFHDTKFNVKIDPAKFNFTPPKGVDVIGG